MKKYLITGITGFAGPALAKILLKDDHEVYGLSRRTNGMETDIMDVLTQNEFNKIKFLYADLTDRLSVLKIFEENKFDGVFHLAAMSLPTQSFIDPVGTFNTNVMGSLHLIDAVEKTQKDTCMFMFCSTSEVYGNTIKPGQVIKESDKLLAANPYGCSKQAIDVYLQERFANGKLNGFITRAFSHTGKRRGKNFSISSDAYQLAKFMHEEDEKKSGKTYKLRVGNLDTIRCVMSVEDCVRAYYLLMQNEKSNGKAFNVCHQTAHKMSFFTDGLIELSGLKIEKVIDQNLFRPIDINYQKGDTTLLKKITGWEPQIKIEETLGELLNYWYYKFIGLNEEVAQ